jgi:hypothetical protein
MAFPEKNYTLGRGKLYFNKFIQGTKTPTGQRYFGNTTEINLTSDSESLDHFDSDNGIRQKDDSVLLSLSRTGSFITDNISPANLALFFLGAEDVVSQAALTAVAETLPDVILGLRYQIGATAGLPAGVRNITTFASTGLVAGVDYTLDGATGGVVFLEGGSVVEGSDVDVTYSTTVTSFNRVVTAANAEIYGSLFYMSTNPKGEKFDYFWPYVSLKPDGDFGLKSDEWQQIGFGFEALKLDDATEVLYINGRPGSGV